MAAKDLHAKPFGQGTLRKLEIFEDYGKAWLPVFILQRKPKICIFDFFAGTGYDKNDVPGSPIRILEIIKQQLHLIIEKRVKVHVYLNEFDAEKFALLKSACELFISSEPGFDGTVELLLFNENFESLFPKLLDDIRTYPSLVYLDQNGVKFLDDEYLLELEKMRETDFLYFASSSYIWRYGERPEFAFLNIDMAELKRNGYERVHRSVRDQLRRRLPAGTPLRLYPFSLKKGTNIYGILFGATHPLAVEKFLAIAWKRNTTNGEADFDIDGETRPTQLELFSSAPRLTKIRQFQKYIREKVLAGEIKNNFEALDFALEEGHIGNHANEILRDMKQKGEITFQGKSPLVAYQYLREGRLLSYSLNKRITTR